VVGVSLPFKSFMLSLDSLFVSVGVYTVFDKVKDINERIVVINGHS